jgi:hypothetical protein
VAAYRLNRLFDARSGRCLDVAVDHGFVGEPALLHGIEDMRAAVERLVDGAPDAIQLTAGQAELLQSRPGRDKPALVLRTDVANVYGRELSVSAERAFIRGEIRAEIGLGLAARLRGDTDAARRHLNRALAKSRSSGHAASAAEALDELHRA